MPSENPLDRQAFDYLARAAGLNTDDPHMDELFPYVQNAVGANEGTEEDRYNGIRTRFGLRPVPLLPGLGREKYGCP